MKVTAKENMDREMINTARKVQVLQRIRAAIGRGERPTMRSLGLREPEIKALVDEELFEFSYSASDPKWEDCRIERLYPKGLALIPSADVTPNYSSLRSDRALPHAFWYVLVLVAVAGLGWYLIQHFARG